MDRYWVTGGNGITNSTTNWSASSGGASGASVPTLTDNAIFDANSGTGTVTINATLSVLNFISTNFGGTFAGSAQITMNGGSLIWGSSVTVNWTGSISCGTGSSGTTFTSNGKQMVGTLVIGTGFPNPGTLNFIDTFKCGSIQHVTATGVLNLNGADIYLIGNAITFSATSGRTIQGTSTIRLVTTNTTLSISITGAIKNNVVINAINTITQTGAVNIGNSTWTYTAGTWVTGTNGFGVVGDVTLDLAGMDIYSLSTSQASIITIASFLNVISSVSQTIATGVEYAGVYGFSCATLTTNASTTGRTIVLAAGVEYFVTSNLLMQSGFGASAAKIISNNPGTKALLTLSQSASEFLPYCDLTDIDASNGATIWTYYGTVSNCTNVRELNHKQPTIGTVN